MNRPTRPSLSDIEPSWGMRIVPYVRCGTISRALGKREALVLDAHATRRLIDYLSDNEQSALIEAHLQRLCRANNDERLLTAISSPDDCRYLCNALGLVNPRVVLAAWIEDGCNEVVLQFRDRR